VLDLDLEFSLLNMVTEFQQLKRLCEWLKLKKPKLNQNELISSRANEVLVKWKWYRFPPVKKRENREVEIGILNTYTILCKRISRAPLVQVLQYWTTFWCEWRDGNQTAIHGIWSRKETPTEWQQPEAEMKYRISIARPAIQARGGLYQS
jgi:hypothetical protein